MTRVTSIQKKSNLISTERKGRYDTTTIVLDLEKCVGCNMCWTVCPRYAIERGPIGASLRNRVAASPIRINYHKCVFCGLCVYICPFNALTLKINDKPSEKLKKGESLPYLEGEIVQCLRTKNSALKYIEGDITIDDTKCPGGCSTCIEICPMKCLFLPKATKKVPWEKTAKVGVNKENCLFCGACVFACPSNGTIKLIRKNIKHSKEGAESHIWQNVEIKLKKPVNSRDWYYEIQENTTPGGVIKLPSKQKKSKGSK